MKTFTQLSKTVFLIMIIFLLPFHSNASVADSLAVNNAKTEKMVANKMINRLKEIKSIDKSKMTRIEKRELRNEVKTIKASLKATGNGKGVYLSIGAIIIIILLLILLL